MIMTDSVTMKRSKAKMNTMKYRKLELAVLDASKTRNLDKMTDVMTILEHSKRVLDMKIDSIPTSNMNLADAEFSKINDEYTEINRLFRITAAYAWC
jgi:hypothetical protein